MSGTSSITAPIFRVQRAPGVLSILNDDRVLPGKGFRTHPPPDMEILTHVLLSPPPALAYGIRI
jgi:hypothetical protein